MGFRITTNMMMNSYRYNLQGSTKKLSDARDMVLTQRNFNSYADDPAAATQEFRLRRTLYQTNSQLMNTQNVYSKFNTAWNNLTEIKNKLLDKTAIQSAIRGDNGATGEARRALATTLRETAESLVHALNQKLGDQFIFAGNDGLNVPFEWRGTDLYYRGINVNSGGLVKKPLADEPGWLNALKTDAETQIEQSQTALEAAQEALAEAKKGMENCATEDDWNAAKAVLDAAQNDLDAAEADLAEKQKLMQWHDYYAHKTDTPPNGDPKEVLEKYITDSGDDPGALSGKDAEWYDYYLHEADEKPAADTPDWMTNIVEKATGKNVKDLTGNDKAWYLYLTGESDVAPENGTRPPWVDELVKTKRDGLTDEKEQAWLDFYRDKDNYMKLKEMSDEELYIDLGMGLAERSPNNPVNGSYFNSALCGIAFTGFGVDEDGDSLNLAVLMRELADVFQAWDEDMDPQGYNPELAGPSAQGLSSEELEEKAFRLLDKLQNAKDNFVENWVELDAESVFLVSNEERLGTLFIDTNTEILNVSQVDLAEAITNFSWQQYCYNAALRIGNQLLSQSLIDYMS